jgi:hypothetical protein
MRGEQGHDFGVGVGLVPDPVFGEFLAQAAEVLDDAVVDHGDAGRTGAGGRS